LGYRVGTGYIGSDSIQTSVAGQEIIPEGYIMYKMTLINNQECTIEINDNDPIFLRAYQGFNMNVHDREIYSLSIVEADIKFSWFGAFV
jgi:hypothetical protein